MKRVVPRVVKANFILIQGCLSFFLKTTEYLKMRKILFEWCWCTFVPFFAFSFDSIDFHFPPLRTISLLQKHLHHFSLRISLFWRNTKNIPNFPKVNLEMCARTFLQQKFHCWQRIKWNIYIIVWNNLFV